MGDLQYAATSCPAHSVTNTGIFGSSAPTQDHETTGNLKPLWQVVLRGRDVPHSSRSCVFPSPVLRHASPLQAKPSVSNCPYAEAVSDGTAGSPAATARIATTWVHLNAHSSESWRGTINFFDWGDSQNFSGFFEGEFFWKIWGGFCFTKFWIFQIHFKNISWLCKIYFLLPKCSLI